MAARLVAAGLHPTEERAKTRSLRRALERLGDSASDARAWWIPGRIEFLGKHTDYVGGQSLLCAAERGFAAVSVPRRDDRVNVYDARSGEALSGFLDARQPSTGHWSTYPLTVCRRIAMNFPGAKNGVDLAFASDLPPAAGLSSSSALMIATFLALSDANDLFIRSEYRQSIHSKEDLAAYLGAVENGSAFGALAGDRGVGTLGGSQDHTAILCSKPCALSHYAFAPTRHKRDLDLPGDHVFVIAASGVLAMKGGAARELYNRAATRAATALKVWRNTTGSAAPTLAAALGESPDMIERLRDILPSRELPFEWQSVLDRVEHLRAELEIIDGTADALAAGDLARVGTLVDDSQANAVRLLDNQVPETIALARSARELGAIAASAFGAGFGGSVYALVHEQDAREFRARWQERYAREFPAASEQATFLLTRAGPAAMQLAPAM